MATASGRDSDGWLTVAEAMERTLGAGPVLRAVGGQPSAAQDAPPRARTSAAPLRASFLPAPASAATAAASAVMRMRASVAATRSVEASLRLTGAREAWRRLGGAEMRAALCEMRRQAAASNKSRASTVRLYEEFCAGNDFPAYPMAADSVTAFLAYRVFVREYKSHATTGTLSNLRCHALSRCEPLSALDEGIIAQTMRVVCTAAPSAPKRGRSLTTEELLATAAACQRDGAAQGRQALALLTWLVGFQSRALELLDGHTRFSDITWCAGGVARKQYLDKTHKQSLDYRPKVAPCLPAGRGLEALCPRRAMLAHLRHDSAWKEAWAGDPVRGKWPVFSKLVHTGGVYRCCATPMSVQDAKDRLRPFFEAAGVRDPGGIDMHFGRATGTHMLTVAVGLDPQLVNAMGGWAAVRQDTMHAHYLTLTPEQLMAAVHDAIHMTRFHFGGLSTRFCCSPLLVGFLHRG